MKGRVRKRKDEAEKAGKREREGLEEEEGKK